MGPRTRVYPQWKYYPAHLAPPDWVPNVVAVFSAAKDSIDSKKNHGISSDQALAFLRPGLTELDFVVESGKKRANKIHRPVLFGENGVPRVAYEVDAFHRDHGIVVEVEAGRGAANNADYRDLIRASLMVDAQYLVLAMMLEYRSGAKATTTKSYELARNRIDAIYESERLNLPLAGILLVGY